MDDVTLTLVYEYAVERINYKYRHVVSAYPGLFIYTIIHHFIIFSGQFHSKKFFQGGRGWKEYKIKINLKKKTRNVGEGHRGGGWG
jgi:hypothetical protein